MKSMIVCFIVGLAALAVTLGVTAEVGKPSEVVSPCVVLTGPDSRILEREYHRITSMKEWTALWQEHKGLKPDEEYDLYHNPAGLPFVNFDRYMIIAVFQGKAWNSAGLEALSTVEEQERIVFRYDDKLYQTAGPGGGGKQVTVYGFFVIPRSTKPLVVEENVNVQKGGAGPPVWEERITFPGL